MIYLYVASGFTLWVICFCLAMWVLLERDGFWYKVPFFVMIFLTAAGFAYVLDSEPDRPCVKYEQRMIYNAALKIPMAAEVCVERGEWVE